MPVIRIWRHIGTVIFCLILPFCRMGAQTSLFEDSGFRQAYASAVTLNGKAQYDDAYRAISDAGRILSERMKDIGITAAGLNRDDFRHTYFPVYISCAEIAYKLGLSSEMRDISGKLANIVDHRIDSDADNRYHRARIAKINGGAAYLYGEYDKAEKEYLKAMDLWTDDFNFTYALRLELAQLLYAQKRYDDALGMLNTAAESLGKLRPFQKKQYDAESRMKDVTSHRAMCLARLGRFDEADKELDKVCDEGNAEWLRRKAKVMMLEYDRTGAYNPLAKRYYQDYLRLARNHVNERFIALSPSEREQYWLAEKSFVTDCYRLEDKAPELLYDVALFSKAVLLQLGRIFSEEMTPEQKSAALSAVRVTWKDVQRKMPDNSTAVEFIVYEKNDTARIGSLVLGKKASAPVFVDISPVSEIASLYHENGMYDEKLPSVLWNTEISRLIGNSTKVYFSSDGILHMIPVEYMVPEHLEPSRLYRITSTRMLAEPHDSLDDGSLLICGGVNYYSDAELDTENKNDAQAFMALRDRNMYLRYLEGSKEEADSIMNIRADERDLLITDSDVSETAVRSLINKYKIIHLSTHGYFAGQSDRNCDIVPMVSDEQLSRSCIFLSGAQRNLDDRSFNPTKFDGILSAREIAGMNLDNVKLVVLSACQSGLGYVTTDGVFGLQRGLKSAGADAMIVSLWNVDDMASSIFFRRLYHNMNMGATLHDAFSEARDFLQNTKLTILKKRTGRHDIEQIISFNNEKYFNAFILIDGFQ